MISVTVVIPDERLPEFYSMLGSWLADDSDNVQNVKPVPSAIKRPGSGRYAPLADYFHASSGAALQLSFDEIEAITGAELPESARRHRAYWANSKNITQGRTWLSTGWIVSYLDMTAEQISFRRVA